jgi:alpha-L-arabinofuranosidase
MLSNRVVIGAAVAAGFILGGLPDVCAAAEPATLTVAVDQPGAKISPMLWGSFFEDINCSADGRIYAELVRNRSLEDTDKPEHWSPVGSGSAKVTLAVDGLTTDKPGTFWLDMVSLFPHKTWKNRPNGLRPDLAEMLAGLKPAFVRFPGGCWVEGDTMNSILTSASPEDENTLEEPLKVAPVERTITLAGPRFQHAFPAHSVSVLRLKPKQ